MEHWARLIAEADAATQRRAFAIEHGRKPRGIGARRAV